MRLSLAGTKTRWPISLLCALITSCSTTGRSCDAWKDCVGSTRVYREEVALSTGAVILLERTIFLDAKYSTPRGETLRARLPSGEAMQFESCTGPLALDFVGGTLYLVAISSFPHCMNELGFSPQPTTRYVAWRKQETTWIRVRYEDVPRELKTNIITQLPDRAMQKPLTAQEKVRMLRADYTIGWNPLFWK